MASRLISFRVDDELAAALDEDLQEMRLRSDLDGYEISELEFFRILFREALDQQAAQRLLKRRKE
jgi:hypothetical protein